MTRDPHPFARFINVLGRGKTLTRSLTVEEAEEAMAMILDGGTLPEQLGAFLMLLRVKEESPEEIAGFVRAVRSRLRPPAGDALASTSTGRPTQARGGNCRGSSLRRWSSLRAGGASSCTGRRRTRKGASIPETALQALGLPVAKNLEEAAEAMARDNFAYLPIDALCPPIADMLDLRPILGLRSPVHTFARMLNPFAAPAMLQGVFHPGYMRLHRDAGLILGQPRLSVFRGEGGEIERRPGKPCDVMLAIDGRAGR